MQCMDPSLRATRWSMMVNVGQCQSISVNDGPCRSMWVNKECFTSSPTTLDFTQCCIMHPMCRSMQRAVGQHRPRRQPAATRARGCLLRVRLLQREQCSSGPAQREEEAPRFRKSCRSGLQQARGSGVCGGGWGVCVGVCVLGVCIGVCVLANRRPRRWHGCM